ncbi:MAG: hypothetical protein CL691_04010 [Cellvibrionales bacterium]|nr:hypothetical protein [Cellvibrionales bacterium]|tara:strand:- start:35888 stop:36148 length:261 start_codon:yes stop_codon:yes gene_type:complete
MHVEQNDKIGLCIVLIIERPFDILFIGTIIPKNIFFYYTSKYFWIIKLIVRDIKQTNICNCLLFFCAGIQRFYKYNKNYFITALSS